MRIIDLTHSLAPGMPIYPDSIPPLFETECTIEHHGYFEKKMSLSTHTGTHVDAPAHMLKGGATLDEIPLERFSGPAAALDFTGFKGKNIEIESLKPYRDRIIGVDFIILNTGWSQHWGTKAYFSGFPVLSTKAADWFGEFQLKGVGMDTISADPVESHGNSIHHILLGQGLVIIENLTNLAALPEFPFDFSCYPLNIKEADGSPVRAVASMR